MVVEYPLFYEGAIPVYSHGLYPFVRALLPYSGAALASLQWVQYSESALAQAQHPRGK